MLPVDAKVQRPLPPFASQAQPADLTQSGRHGAVSTPMPLIVPRSRRRLDARSDRTGVGGGWLSSRAVSAGVLASAGKRVLDETAVTLSETTCLRRSWPLRPSGPASTSQARIHPVVHTSCSSDLLQSTKAALLHLRGLSSVISLDKQEDSANCRQVRFTRCCWSLTGGGCCEHVPADTSEELVLCLHMFEG